MNELTHQAVYNPREIHLGLVDDCFTCNGRVLAFPKPPPRIKDPELLARFAVVRPRCQVCESTTRLEIHHMTDLLNMHRRSDVFENLMRMCRECHHDRFHDGLVWTKPELRRLKDINESVWREQYAELEMLYDGEVRWAA